jgi:4-amino-4-deoxy-L-arabinose transferase-like glycosyltransferase
VSAPDEPGLAPRAETTRPSTWQPAIPFLLAVACFFLTIAIVDPLRETAMEDDWAYALTVRHLLETGHYRLNDWASANMPFQAYWGALFASVGGDSFSSLRLSTLCLALLGLIACRNLAREHGLDRPQAGIVALVLVSSPLVLRFSFNFMTDVPFLSLLMTALWLYSRALRLRSPAGMLLASVVGAAAILTRQFGLALVAGLALLWWIAGRERRDLPLFAIGIAAPAIAGAWQILAGILHPNWGARYSGHAQSLYLGRPGVFLINLAWRPTLILQYLAFFCLPLVVVALLALARRGEPAASGRRSRWAAIAAITACVVGGIAYGRFARYRSWFMPYLLWNLSEVEQSSLVLRAGLTVLTTAGAILLAYGVYERNRPGRSERLPASQRLLDCVTLFLLAQQLIFFEFGDEYLLVFMPYALIVYTRMLGDGLRRFATVTIVLCLAIALTAALWTRGLLAREEAMWSAAESLRASGVPSERIYARWTWVSYYGFQDYVAEVGDRKLDDLSDLFNRWFPARYANAEYVVVDSTAHPHPRRGKVVAEVPYRGFLLDDRRVYVVKLPKRGPRVRP